MISRLMSADRVVQARLSKGNNCMEDEFVARGDNNDMRGEDASHARISMESHDFCYLTYLTHLTI